MFQKAIKQESKLRMAVAGPSGSGKTYTALTLAKEFGRIAVIDTEHGSASKYADLFDFDVINMEPPFDPRRFVSMIGEAAKAGYDVVVIDSLSHAWNGTGGLLEIVEAAGARAKGNSYAGWKEGTPIQNGLIDGITRAPLHIVATMRSKTEYVLQMNDKGKSAPVKMGMAPIQRDGFEYEFDVVLEMDADNTGIVTKTRCVELAQAVIRKPDSKLAKTLANWLSGEPAPLPTYTAAFLGYAVKELGLNEETIVSRLATQYPVPTADKTEAKARFDWLKAQIEQGL